MHTYATLMHVCITVLIIVRVILSVLFIVLYISVCIYIHRHVQSYEFMSLVRVTVSGHEGYTVVVVAL